MPWRSQPSALLREIGTWVTFLEPGSRSGVAARQDACGVVDRIDPFHRGQDRIEVARVGQLELESQASDSVGLCLRSTRQDVHVVLREHFGDIPQELGTIE